MANYLNLEQSSISKFEKGERNLSVDNLEKSCSLFGVKLLDLYNDKITLKPLYLSLEKRIYQRYLMKTFQILIRLL